MKKKLIKTTLLTSIMGLILSVVFPSILSVRAAIQEDQVTAAPEKGSGAYVPTKEELKNLGLSEAEIAELMKVQDTGITLKNGVAYDEDGKKLTLKERGKLSWAVKILRKAWNKIPKKVKNAMGGVAGFEAILSFIDHFTGKVSDAIYLGCRKIGLSKAVSWWVMKILTLIAF
ncbi:hypothetical protein [Listeria valentina]|uniref:hypothetical protein n=1 Tax=Listeria valentina TaxID=2705293 RepID=UPI001431623C|nr:hypothetical protein [Listeria valentina]